MRILLLLATIFLSGYVVALPPDWINNLTREFYNIGLKENLEIGTVIGYLLAQDPEGDPITYSTASDIFAVDAQSGEVTLKKKLDFKTMNTLTVEFRVEDSGGSWRSITHSLKIVEINHFPPVFRTTAYTIKVDENMPVNRVLLDNITVTDGDTSGAGSEIELTCHVGDSPNPENDSCTTFRLDIYRPRQGQLIGRLVLVKPLDFEQKRRHNLIIRATDDGDPPKQADITVTLDVLDVQDTPPRFLNGPISLHISENTAKDTSVGQIQARDGDEGSQRALVMRIISDTQRLFRLGPVVRDNTGTYTSVIYTNVDMNREDVTTSYSFTVEIVEMVQGVESQAKTTTVVRMLLQGVNDNPPTFNQRVYTVNVPEGLERKAKIPGINIVVTDKDGANSGYFELEIVNGTADGQEVFELSPAYGAGSASVSLLLLEPTFLDYEQPRYRTWEIAVVARETRTAERFSSTATVRINVQDVNDNSPIFQFTEYTAPVREDRRRGRLIKTITATDADTGINGRITYSLLGDYSDFFRVNKETGEIFLEKQLDYEDKKVIDHQIKLTFRATDGGGKHTDVPFQVSIMNFNDEGPVFDRAIYETTVGETSTVLDPNITISANDTESDLLAVVTYRIIRGNTHDYAFQIHPMTGFVSLRRPVEYRETPGERGTFNLVVEASDNGRPPMKATVTLRVRVTDENNHEPKFTRSLYTGRVSEISEPGFSVVTVRATDQDFDRNAEVRYILQSGGRDNFEINRETGRIQVSSHADLSIDKFGSQYNLIVYAVDRGTPVRTGTSTVRIDVEDINNKNPTFVQDVYLRFLSQDVAVGTSLLTVTARDPDQGSNIEYSIVTSTMQVKDKNGNLLPNSVQSYYQQAFRIDSRSGEVTSTAKLDRERAGEITFEVQARDTEAKQPSDQIARATVVITVNSKEYEGPVFQQPWTPKNSELMFNINEEEPAGTRFATLVAHDPHTKQPIRNFRKVQGSDPSNYFRVDSATGQLFVNKRLDYESMPSKQLSFQVQAVTGGPDRKSSIATIIVTVQDINDNAPKFSQDSYEFNVPENTTYPSEVYRVDATDADSHHFSTITYSISGQGEKFFTIHPTQGYVSVAPNVTLDRETTGSFKLIVTATDGFKKSTSVPMTIHLGDVNDNSPQFKQSVYYFNPLETVEQKSRIGEVTATDADQGGNGRITYKFSDTNSQREALARFVIDEVTGVIKTKASLRDSAPNTYNLTVIAFDGGKPAHTGTAQVIINVQDLGSDGKPSFTNPRRDGQVFNISEDAGPGTEVTQIKAEDRIPGPPGPNGYRIRYGFMPNSAYGEDQEKFHIDPNTGVITIKEPLDREKKKSYTLMLHIRDYSGDPEENTRRIVVNLTDVDDNRPSFLTCPDADGSAVNVEVREEQAAPVTVTTVKACDLDDPPFNKIRYAITCGNDDRLTSKKVRPFYIDPETGVITTQARLDYEYRRQYKLCVRAVDQYADPLEPARDDPDTENDAVLIVNVAVLDVSDIGPIFKNGGVNGTLQAGVSSFAGYGTKVVQIIADTDDSRSGITAEYGISNLVYRSGDDEVETSQEVFRIDSKTGWITTNVVNLHDLGPPTYFKMDVTAKDATGRITTMPLYIYMVRGDQSLRFVFDSSPDHTDFQALINKLNGYSTPSDVVVYHVDSLRYHLGTTTGQVAPDWERTDVCFHAVKDNRALDKDEVLQRFNDAKKRDEFKIFMYEMKMNETISMCKVRMTTMWWGGYYWWWWWLIALALFIFLVALILIICICCFWDRYNRYRPDPAMPPIIVKGSTVHTIPNGSTGRVQTSEYEWQEKVHIMN